MFLVCSHHQNPEDALCIGERGTQEGQYLAPPLKRMDDWYAKHMGCGRGCDHFQLAYQRPQDHDLPKIAEPVPTAVRLALVNGSH